MVNTLLTYKDKYASYQLSIENRVICAVVTGAIGKTCVERYNSDFHTLMEQLGDAPWGHFADFSQCEALTKEAQDASEVLHHQAKQQGCVVSAFLMNSALLTSQVNSIRRNNDLPSLTNQRFFATRTEALQYIENFLATLNTTCKSH